MMRVCCGLLHAAGHVAAIRGPMPAGNFLLAQRTALHCTRMMFDGSDDLGVGPRPPSAKQIAYAQSLAQSLSLALPGSALIDSSECSIFIDDALSQMPPTEKQFSYASTLAQAAGIPLPEEVRSSRKAASEFIEAHKGASLGGSPSQYGGAAYGGAADVPSDKQIVFAASLARARGLGLSAEALKSKGVMSEFIDKCQAEASGQANMDPGAARALGASGIAGAVGAFGVDAGGSAALDDFLGPSDTRAGDAGDADSAEGTAPIDDLDELFGDPADPPADAPEQPPSMPFKEGGIPF